MAWTTLVRLLIRRLQVRVLPGRTNPQVSGPHHSQHHPADHHPAGGAQPTQAGGGAVGPGRRDHREPELRFTRKIVAATSSTDRVTSTTSTPVSAITIAPLIRIRRLPFRLWISSTPSRQLTSATTGVNPPPARWQLDTRPPRHHRVGTGLACGAASGNPPPGREPAGCLLDGLPPGRRPGQGRFAVLRTGLRPPLTRSSSRRPGETRSPGAGEEQRPTSRRGGDSSCGDAAA